MELFSSYRKAIADNNALIRSIYPPIRTENINQYISDLQIPKEYIQFLEINNGVVIGEFQLFSLDKIKIEMISMKRTYEEYWDNKFVPFASHLGVGDYLSFGIKEEVGSKEYEIYDCFHELPPSQWKYIEKSFSIWLDKFVNSNFEPYWLNWTK